MTEADLAARPLVIVGPTASGKSELAVEVAHRLTTPGRSFEIVSADAMAVYRGMDVGTAKPTPAQQAAHPHHGIDVADPTDDYTVADYQADVETALAGIEERGNIPIVVGGTGLYVRAVVDSFTIPGRFPAIRERLESEPDTAALHARLAEADPAAADKMLPTNRRRIIRALEVVEGTGRPFSSFGPGVDQYPPTRWVLVGLDIDRSLMDERINARYDRQMAEGLLAEVESIRLLGPSRTAAQALGYKELFDHLEGRCSIDDALEEARRRTRRFARRQQRWFRRDPRIRWFDVAGTDLAAEVARYWVEQSEIDRSKLTGQS